MGERKPTTVGFIPKKKKKVSTKPVNTELVDSSVVNLATGGGKPEEKSDQE